MPLFSFSMIVPLISVTGLLVLGAILLILVLLKKNLQNTHLDWITAAGFAIVAVLTFILGRPGEEPQLLWGEMIRLDRAGYLLSLIVLTGGSFTSVFAGTDASARKKPEFFLLLTLSSIGLILMGLSANLIMLYLAIETAAIPLYVLAGIKYREEWSVEAGIKYFLFGGFSSAIMLYGFSLLYGFSGTVRIYGLLEALQLNNTPLAALILAAIMVLAGFTFKISAVPFHFWTPDVYQGSPTPVAGFLSTVSKAAGFVALIRVLIHVFGVGNADIWMIIVAVLAAATMFIGNLLAIPQKNFKRLIAYSSIAQAGYILVGVASGTEFGFTGAVYYLAAYLVTNLAVFAIINWIENETGSTEISAFAGLNRREPGLAFLLMVALLSLGGIPPLAGFFAKVLVFGAAIQNGMAWLAILGIINSVIALYYYLRVMKVMYVDQPLPEIKVNKLPVIWAITLSICIIGIVLLGIVYSPLYNYISLAAIGL